MPQAVIIQHEPTLSLSGKKVASAKDAGDVEAFSVQLDKQVKQSQPDKKTEQTDTVDAAKPADADKELAADGNNLPTEETAENGQSQTAEEDNTISADAETISADEPDVDAEPVVTVNAAATSTTATNTDAENDAKPNVSEKPIRAQVTVSQQAVDHAKAAPVEMTAKTHPQQTTAPNTQSETVEKVVNDSEKTLSKLLKTDTAQSVNSKVVTDTVTSEKTVAPNLAAVLKETGQEESKTPKLRADILEALQRQQTKQEVGMSLRNVMASQMTAKANTSPSTLTTPVLTDTTSPLTPLTSGSLLTSATQSSAQGASLSPAVLSLPIQPSMQNTAWGQVMSSRVVWMAKEGVQEAQLRMNPANLGPVEVKLHVQNDQASVTFLAQHSATRDALEQALPRLRESFAENGMELTNAHVGEQEQHQQQEQSEQANESPIFAQASRQDDDIESEAVEIVSSVQETAGLSLYA